MTNKPENKILSLQAFNADAPAHRLGVPLDGNAAHIATRYLSQILADGVPPNEKSSRRNTILASAIVEECGPRYWQLKEFADNFFSRFKARGYNRDALAIAVICDDCLYMSHDQEDGKRMTVAYFVKHGIRLETIEDAFRIREDAQSLTDGLSTPKNLADWSLESIFHAHVRIADILRDIFENLEEDNEEILRMRLKTAFPCFRQILQTHTRIGETLFDEMARCEVNIRKALVPFEELPAPKPAQPRKLELIPGGLS